MKNIDDLIAKGTQFLESGNYDEALDYFEQALLLNPNDPKVWNKKGVTLRSAGRYSEAIDCFNKSQELEPTDRNAS